MMGNNCDKHDEFQITSRDTIGIKGICACMVMITHLHGRVDLFRNSVIGTIFAAFGYLAVAMFFFFSGFGLTSSLENKGKRYLTEFPKKKLITLYFLNCLLIGIYLVIFLMLGIPIIPSDLIKSFVGGGTIIPYGWYLQVQLLLYILFFIVNTYVKTQKILVFFASCFLFCILAYLVKLPITWYESVFAFPMGIIAATHQHTISTLITRNYWWYFCISLLLFCVTFIVKGICPVFIMQISAKVVSALAFVLLFILIKHKIKLTNNTTIWLGRISLEIYVLQGVFLTLYHSEYIYIKNEWLYCGVVIGCTVIAAFFFHPVVQSIYRAIGGEDKTN